MEQFGELVTIYKRKDYTKGIYKWILKFNKQINYTKFTNKIKQKHSVIKIKAYKIIKNYKLIDKKFKQFKDKYYMW